MQEILARNNEVSNINLKIEHTIQCRLRRLLLGGGGGIGGTVCFF